MPSPIITFKDVYSFMADKALSRKGKQADSYLLAEGLVDGKVVATHRVRPARRPSQIVLALDNEKTPQKADGGDLVTVVASITDRDGNVKHLNNYFVKFQVEGEGRIVGGAGVLANPAPVKWGAAPVLVRSTLRPGKVKLTASVLFEGSQLPATAVLEWETVPADHPMVYDEAEAQNLSGQAVTDMGRPAAAKSAEEITAERRWKEAQQLKLKEVERQQTEFGEQREEGQ